MACETASACANIDPDALIGAVVAAVQGRSFCAGADPPTLATDSPIHSENKALSDLRANYATLGICTKSRPLSPTTLNKMSQPKRAEQLQADLTADLRAR